MIQITVDFSSESTEIKRQLNKNFKILKEKNYINPEFKVS